MSRVPDVPDLPGGMDEELRFALTQAFEDHARHINHYSQSLTIVASAATVAHDVVLASCGASTLVVSLVPAINFQDKVMAVKKIDAGSGPIVITPDGSETIDGTVSYTVSGQFTTVQIVSDGDGWWVI